MLAVIPARGHSKGLPGKNIKLLNGKPLICHTIEAAKEAENIDRILISTDSEDIAMIAEKAGAWVPSLRPAALAKDDSTSTDVFAYTLRMLQKEHQLQIEDFVVLQPTSPLRTSEDIDNAIHIFREKSADSVIAFTPAHHPVNWHKSVDKQGKIHDILLESKMWQRQSLPRTYYPNGAIYVLKSHLILESRSYYTDNTYAYVMPHNRSIDIDDIVDFKLAELLMTERIS